jgi:hypothetical protein
MVEQELRRGRYDPYWTWREYSRGGARDGLGVETLSQSILTDPLPAGVFQLTLILVIAILETAR